MTDTDEYQTVLCRVCTIIRPSFVRKSSTPARVNFCLWWLFCCVPSSLITPVLFGCLALRWRSVLIVGCVRSSSHRLSVSRPKQGSSLKVSVVVVVKLLLLTHQEGTKYLLIGTMYVLLLVLRLLLAAAMMVSHGGGSCGISTTHTAPQFPRTPP